MILLVALLVATVTAAAVDIGADGNVLSIPSEHAVPTSATNGDRITAVLCLAIGTSADDDGGGQDTATDGRDDLGRAKLLIASMRARMDVDHVLDEFLVVVPDRELPTVRDALLPDSGALQKKMRFVPERSLLVDDDTGAPLFHEAWDTGADEPWAGNAVQMALKLLVSRVVRTPFYLTLDADVLVAGGGRGGGDSGGGGRARVTLDDLLPSTGPGTGGGGRRALYWPEPRGVHAHWWRASAALLRMGPKRGSEEGADPGGGAHAATGPLPDPVPQHLVPGGEAGFGVTPALLSTAGARLVLRRLRALYGARFVARWIGAWGKPAAVDLQGPPPFGGNSGAPENLRMWWSEYTLYRLVLAASGVFDALHACDGHCDGSGSPRLVCTGGGGGGGGDGGDGGGGGSVWFAGGGAWRAWNAAAVFDQRGRGPWERRCLFAVVQSTAQVPVAELAAAVGPWL